MPFNFSNVTIKNVRHDIFKKEVTVTVKFPFDPDEMEELNNLRKNRDLLYDLELTAIQARLPGFGGG